MGLHGLLQGQLLMDSSTYPPAFSQFLNSLRKKKQVSCHSKKVYGEVETYIHASASEIDGGDRSDFSSGNFTPEKSLLVLIG
jgi:hypothetical protein